MDIMLMERKTTAKKTVRVKKSELNYEMLLIMARNAVNKNNDDIVEEVRSLLPVFLKDGHITREEMEHINNVIAEGI